MALYEQEIPRALLASLYAVLDDQARWKDFLGELCDFVGTTFASLTSIVVDPTPTFLRFCLWGMSDEDAREYRKSWVYKDPWGSSRDISALIPGTILRGEDCVPDDVLERNEAYIGFLKARNMHYGAGAFLSRSERIVTVMSVSRSKQAGPLTEAELERLRSLLPNVQRVLRIQDETSHLKTQHEILRGLLDQASVGIVLLDQGGAALTINSRARSLMESGSLLFLEGRTLRASCADCDRALQEATRRALDPFKTESAGEVVPLGRRLPDHAMGGPLLWLLIVPARPGKTLTPSSTSPAVIVQIIDPATPPWIDQDALRRVFLLSKTEAAVAASLAGGLSITETAASLHVSHHTVRSHLKMLFLKTRTNQQSSLVSLILRLHSPLT